jgi:tRNA U34 5-methylaminomethyl-2-thiouridine-forming methyltransferase MnmC
VATTNPASGVSYDRRTLAEAYLLAQASEGDANSGYRQERSAYNTALRVHRQRVLAALETLFGLTLDMRSASSTPGGAALFMLFNSTVRSCLALRTPWSDYLEAGLLHRRLAEVGGAGVRRPGRGRRGRHATQQP